VTDTRYRGTIDWDRYWREADEDDVNGASPSADLIAESLLEFLEETGVPSSSADLGCGADAAVFALAERYPGTTVVGYDAAKPVLARNREQTREAGLGNVAFERAALSGFDPERRFDVVSCFYTLVYVDDVECALDGLYDAVAPGGFLAFTYHNRLARAQLRSVAAATEETLTESSPFDPERYAERFELLIEGENLLSYDRIHDVLGTWPRSVWSIVGQDQRYPAWCHNPLVYVPKPP
jgi:SAM-dependent methyltransferase